jgi:tetratricopeptide (TPR) repeat protein
MPVPVRTSLRPTAACAAGVITLCAVAFLLFAPSLAAQQDTTPGWPLHNSAPDHALADADSPLPVLAPDADESCLLWTISKASGTVSAADLKVPEKAKGEYRKSCSDLKGKKLADAETHLRKAVQLYPEYAAAWALLGEVLEAGQHMEDARNACAQASGADPAFAPAYLCLADLAAQSSDWHLTFEMADRSLALAPQQNLYGHFYSAVAEFHLQQLPEAQNDASKAIDDDRFHRVPQAHLLLAQIFAAQHNLFGVSDQLRAYLKAAPHAPDAATVQKNLADVEAQLQK